MGLFKALFGESRKEVWGKLAQELDLEVIQGGLWKEDKLVARIGPWTITLDTYTVSTGKSAVTYTRMRVPYFNQDGFRFKVDRKGVFSGMSKLLGGWNGETGVPEFDESFNSKSNNPEKLRALFANEQIPKLILLQPRITLEVKDNEGWFGTPFPEGVDELHFQAVGVIKDPELLKKLFYLFSLLLKQLCEIGSTYEAGPEIRLK